MRIHTAASAELSLQCKAHITLHEIFAHIEQWAIVLSGNLISEAIAIIRKR